MFLNLIFFIKTFSYPQCFLPLTFLDPLFFLPKFFFDPKLFFDPNFFWTGKYFWTQNHFGPNFFWTRGPKTASFLISFLELIILFSTNYFAYQPDIINNKTKMGFGTIEINLGKPFGKSKADGLV